ncbi:MAG: D-glycero-beta-D-manno-heptose 1-phosphate adenylyltransferase [bacterium]
MDKYKSLKQLKRIISFLRSKSKRIVFTNGCFDLLHSGHVRLLSKAKSLGDVLIIGLNSDNSVRRIKKKGRPVQNLIDRVVLLTALESVDYIISFNEDTPDKLIKNLRPDVLVKGGDYKLKDIVGREYVKKVVRVKLKKNKSTTNLIKKIKKVLA